MKVVPYVITLSRSKERTHHVLNEFLPQLYNGLPKLSKNPIVHEAVDGSVENLNDTLLSRYGISLKKKTMLKGQIGCFLSHFQLWRALVDETSSSKCYMIFEDDTVVVDSSFWTRVENMLREVRETDPNWKWIYLYVHDNQYKKQGGSEKFKIYGKQHIEKACVTYGTVAYIISKEGARFLRDHFQEHGLSEAFDDSVMSLVENGATGFFSYKGNLLVDTVGQVYRNDVAGSRIPSIIWEQKMSFSEDVRKQPTFYKETELRQCQLVMTRMLHIFDEIMRKFNVSYCIMYGTLLGAVRHAGFIPWDCDVDVAVRQEDLKRIKDILISNMPDDMFYQDKETDPFFDSDQVVKLRDRYSSYYEWVAKRPHKKYHNGLQLDIFPFHLEKDGKRSCAFNDNVEHWPDDWMFEGGNELRFEGRWLKCPKQINTTLKQSYQNLDEPPRKEERVPHEGKASAIIPCEHKESRKWPTENIFVSRNVSPICFYFPLTAVKEGIFVAVEQVLTHVRNHYPDAPIFLFEYESEKFEHIAQRFNCFLLKRSKRLFTFESRYVYFFDETSHWQMIEDLHYCSKESGCRWVMKLEADVLIRSNIGPTYLNINNNVGILGARFNFNRLSNGVISFINEKSPFLREKRKEDDLYSFAGGSLVNSLFLRTLIEKKQDVRNVFLSLKEMPVEGEKHSAADVDDVFISILCYYFGFDIIDKGIVMETKHTKDEKVLVFAPVVHAYKHFYNSGK